MYENEGPSVDVKGVNVKVYMANTDLEENTKWIPETDYTLVYEGPLNVPAKKSDELTIALKKPFHYQAGKNLAVLTVSESLENYYNLFWYASYNRGAKRVLIYGTRRVLTSPPSTGQRLAMLTTKRLVVLPLLCSTSKQTQQASTSPSPTCRALPMTSSPLMASR